MTNTKKEIKISNFATFEYVKQQLEQEILQKEGSIKKNVADKIPFGMGNVLLNSKTTDGGLKDAIKKEVIANSFPMVKNLAASFFKNNKMKLVVWAVAITSGIAIKIVLSNKLLKK